MVMDTTYPPRLGIRGLEIEMTNQEKIALYQSLKTKGLDQVQICYGLMDRGVSFEEAGKICWLVETGKDAPEYGLYADGRQASKAESQYLASQE